MVCFLHRVTLLGTPRSTRARNFSKYQVGTPRSTRKQVEVVPLRRYCIVLALPTLSGEIYLGQLRGKSNSLGNQSLEVGLVWN